MIFLKFELGKFFLQKVAKIDLAIPTVNRLHLSGKIIDSSEILVGGALTENLWPIFGSPICTQKFSVVEWEEKGYGKMSRI